MCGIAGFIKSETDKFNNQIVLDAMLEKIIHRGPDDQGVFFDGSLAMGMRRLSIIDLQGGHQPIFNEKKDICIIFNGEIYNYRELKESLLKEGHIFSTKSDTEVIIHLYEKYGKDCVNFLNGMFTFAIWDIRTKELFLARDRLGVKPLYYYFDGASFIFGSEMKTILEYPGIKRKIDYKALNLYFAFYYIPAPYTIFENIKKLLPGHTMLLSTDNKLQINKYWDIKLDNNINKISYEQHKDNIRNILKDSVKRRMIADVPLGAFLSGGIDSSIIVGLMTQNSSIPIETFNISFEGMSVFDESSKALDVARLNKTNHHRFNLGFKDLQEVLPKMIWDLEEPFADSSSVPTYYVARETRRHVKVVLTGDGGDEVFAGYSKYTSEYWYELYRRLPYYIRKNILPHLLNILPSGRGNEFKEIIRKAKKFVSSCDEGAFGRHHSLMLSFSEEMRQLLFTNSEYVYNEISKKLIESYYNEFSDTDNVFKMQYTDIKVALPDDMLTKVDKMTMLNSLEARSPFLDYRLVEYAFNIPTIYKMRKREGKYILKDAFRDLLPSSVINGAKKGFCVPAGEWFRNELKGYIQEVLSKDKIAKQGIFNFDYIDNLLKAHINGKHDYTNQIWSLIVFQIWYDMYAI